MNIKERLTLAFSGMTMKWGVFLDGEAIYWADDYRDAALFKVQAILSEK